VSTTTDLQPLTARSVILSILLGSHPPLLPVSFLVVTGQMFGISDGTTRTALSRLTADGDVVADGSYYRLSPRLLDRQQRQDEALRPATKAWRGGWELAVAGPDVRSAAERSALGADLARLRLAELRPGVWVRPDNLLREWPDDLAERAWRFESRSAFDQAAAAELVAKLWDLTTWASQAETLLESLSSAQEPADRFIVAAAAVRHLQHDPMLPHTLVPPRWPASRLRGAYSAYQRELSELLREQRAAYEEAQSQAGG
jgi:phenylacetic acid degradation operon negative regulatory protein